MVYTVIKKGEIRMKKIIAIIMILVLILSLAACKKDQAPDTEEPVVKTPVEEPVDEEDEVVDPTPAIDSREVTLYFLNEKYIETGDESLEKLIPETRTIEIGNISLEESIVRELMAGPKTEGVLTVIPSSAQLLGVEVADKTAFVNFASEGLFGGSLEETYTINQIVASLVDLDSVDRVQFFIDGQKGDSLMGHYSIEEPFESPIGQ